MAGRGRGKTLVSTKGNSQIPPTLNGNVDPVSLYRKMYERFSDTAVSDSLHKHMKEVLSEATENPELAIDIAKYLFLFMKNTDKSLGYSIRKAFLKELELSYNDYIKAESDSIKYRNFTYFFGTCLYYIREPDTLPLKDLMSALLILISRLDILENIEDSIVFSKCVALLSGFIKNEEMVGSSLLLAVYQEALNRLRELFSSGKGNIVCLGCLEVCLNGGVLSDSGKEFYCKSLPKDDFKVLDKDFSISIPSVDKSKYVLSSFSKVTYF